VLNSEAFIDSAAWLRKTAATVCLAALLAMAAIQAVHMHANAASTQNGGVESHCSLCMVSHCVLRPQQAYVLSLPARIRLRTPAAYAPQVSQSRIFDWFVRPPPAV
jgi:hypothetical protein